MIAMFHCIMNVYCPFVSKVKDQKLWLSNEGKRMVNYVWELSEKVNGLRAKNKETLKGRS